MLSVLKEAFEVQKKEQTEKARYDAERTVKKAEMNAQTIRILNDSATKVFNSPLASYKCKADLITIAGALELPADGTIVDLTARGASRYI